MTTPRGIGTFVGSAILALVAALAVAAPAQSYLVSQNGKQVGTASLALNSAAQGYALTSGVKIKMKDLTYSFTQTAALDAGYHLNSAQLSGVVNGAAATVNTVRAGQQFLMKINADGHVTSQPLAFYPGAVLMPDFDPGALQLILNQGAAVNNRDIWALIPKQTGMEYALSIATKADEQGVLNGQSIPVHHLTITSDAGTIELFSTPSNQLLQAEWTDQAFALVRQGFKLKPPARAPGPPPQPAQTQQPQQQ